MSNNDTVENAATSNTVTETKKGKTRIRGGHRAHLTKVLGKIAGLLSRYEPGNEVELLAYRDTLES